MSAQHTPGPLKASKGWDGDPERWVIVTESNPHYHIAKVENGQPGDTCETEGHTARLFAAAPDLLTQLESLKSWVKNWDCPFTDDPEFSWEPIEAAIAKAKGGQP